MSSGDVKSEQRGENWQLLIRIDATLIKGSLRRSSSLVERITLVKKFVLMKGRLKLDGARMKGTRDSYQRIALLSQAGIDRYPHSTTS